MRRRSRRGAPREGVTITSDNPDLGEVREELETEYNAEPIAIGFNPKYADVGVEPYAATDSLVCTIGLGRSASRAGTRTRAVVTQAISPISDAMPKPRIARFSLMRSEP
ncbi:MAG: hypothetical protein E6J90_51725 [Deltaproteobacteria bacterium]|nr:MAG: hypothetical protein E6J90_51725 [Deltaproteobacteria bacterium]TMQ18063.1 MAG: hypothetical protein E6J91_08815 [Deltaproteobacteria bacterium]